MKAGTKIKMAIYGFNGTYGETVTVIEATEEMLPLPTDYVPVRDSKRKVFLLPVSRILPD